MSSPRTLSTGKSPALLRRMECVVPGDNTVADLPLVAWQGQLAPGGALALIVPTVMAPALSIPLLLAGYVDTATTEDGTIMAIQHESQLFFIASASLAAYSSSMGPLGLRHAGHTQDASGAR